MSQNHRLSSIDYTMFILPKLISTFLISATTLSQACLMAPKTYKGEIGQNMHEAVMFHADGREELVLGIKYNLRPDKGEKLPETFAWVITVPNEPDHYTLAERSIFKKTFAWADPLVNVSPPTNSFDSKRKARTSDGILLSDEVKIGPYTIQPGMHAIKGLNKWLDDNGFPQEDVAHMKYFIENNFTFLCVKVNPAATKKSVPGAGAIKPLHLSFASEQPYFPLKFSSRQGVFGVNVWMFTKDKIDSKKCDPIFAQLAVGKSQSLDKITLRGDYQSENVSVKSQDFPAPLAKLLKNTQYEKVKNTKQWNLSLIRSKAVNQKIKIADWKTDLFFPLVKK